MNRPNPGIEAPRFANSLARSHTRKASHDSRSFFASMAWLKGSAPRFRVAAFRRSPTTSVTKSSAQSIWVAAMVALSAWLLREGAALARRCCARRAWALCWVSCEAVRRDSVTGAGWRAAKSVSGDGALQERATKKPALATSRTPLRSHRALLARGEASAGRRDRCRHAMMMAKGEGPIIIGQRDGAATHHALGISNHRGDGRRPAV